jgi:hypothetical protein
LHRIVLVVDRGGGARQIVDFIHFYIERKAHVVAHELEAGMREQVLDISLRAGEEIVYAEHFIAASEQAIDQMRANESRTTGDENALLRVVLSGHELPSVPQLSRQERAARALDGRHSQ